MDKLKEYEKLVNYCQVDITLSDFTKISKNHPNLSLHRAFENIVNYGRFVDFRKLLDVMLLFPDENFDSFSLGQLESKKWLISCLNKMNLKHPNVLVVGGWHGVLALMLEHYAYFEFMCLTTDIDPDCTSIANILGCYAETKNMFEIDYENIIQDLIINTSCEHLDFDFWIKLIPKSKLVCLQSTDLEWKTHIDNVYSLDEFINRTNLSEVFISDEKKLIAKNQEYNRYMLIGRK